MYLFPLSRIAFMTLFSIFNELFWPDSPDAEVLRDLSEKEGSKGENIFFFMKFEMVYLEV